MNTAISGSSWARIDNAALQLRADHRYIEECFSRYYTEEDETRWSNLMHTALTALKVHMALEEEIFYPAFLLGNTDMARNPDADADRATIKRIISDLESHDPGDSYYERKVHVLWNLAKTQMTKQENCGGMLDLALLTRMDLRALGHKIRIRRQELLVIFSPR